jgi:glycosyltransferase involved in cell wall biosynthesis
MRGPAITAARSVTGALPHLTSPDPTVAVVIPVRDEERAIGACLDAILGGTRVPDEIVVVDGGSTDRTRTIVEGYRYRGAPIRIVENPARTIPAALNRGWRASSCDLIVRIDGHAVISSDYVKTAAARLVTGEWHGVGGRKEARSSTPTGRAVAAAMGSRLGVGNSRYHYAVGAEDADHVPFGAYPRSVIEALCGWDESLLVNQDFEFDYRLRQAGGRLLFDPAMRSSWACSSSLTDLAHQYHRYGRGKAKVALKHPRSVRVRHLLPPAVTLMMSTVALASLLPNRRGPRALVAAYVSALLVTLWSSAARDLPPSARVRFPAVIAIMHNAWGAGFLHGILDRLSATPLDDPYRPRRLELDAPSDAVK